MGNESGHIHIARIVNRNSVGLIIKTCWTVITGSPLFLSGHVVLDGGVVITGLCPNARSGHICIPRAVGDNCGGIVISLSRSIIAGDPLFLTRRIVFDGGVILTKSHHNGQPIVLVRSRRT